MKTTVRIASLSLACVCLLTAVGFLRADEPPLPVGAPTTRPAASEPALPAGAPGEPALPTGAPSAGEPALPTGAPSTGDPALPTGAPSAGEPALPTGAPSTGEPPKPPATGQAPGAVRKPQPAGTNWLQAMGLSGFLDFRAGIRTQHDPHEKQASLGETRAQLDFQKTWNKVTFKVVADFVEDPVPDHQEVNLYRGRGWMDLRQANAAFGLTSWLDVKAGRQILTWGTGDLLFINDMFPKDWQAFFIGRDVEYLKAPSDAVKMSFYSDLANLDVVYTPRFNADRYITGERISYYNSSLGRLAGRDAEARVDRPDECFQDDEWAARLYKNVQGYELAAYGYWGFWKSPGGFDPATARATFPRLSVYGASVRGQVGAGIGNLEAGYYDSRDDRNGDDPFINNSQFRFLAGYERDLPMIARDLTVGVQYYVELMMQHDQYVQSVRALHAGMPTADFARQVLTFRVTKLLMDQNLRLSLFAYYSPTDADAYLRPNVNYKIDDHWSAEVGGNVFVGQVPHTFFGQFRDNSNVYAALRYSF